MKSICILNKKRLDQNNFKIFLIKISCKSLIIFLLSCLSYATIFSQELYFWNAVTENGIENRSSIPAWYEMYKFNSNNNELTLEFDLQSTQFEHNNMNGQAFFIKSFAINRDKDIIYFLEDEGDIYRYTVSDAILTYLIDITPVNSDIFYNIQNVVNQIDFINDSLLLVTGRIEGFYNINSNIFTKTDACQEPCHADNQSVSTCLHKDKILSINYFRDLILYDYDSLYNLSIIFNLPDTAYGFLSSNILSCSSMNLNIIEQVRYKDSLKISNIDINNKSIEYIRTIGGFTNKDFPFKNNLMDIQHFNTPTWEDCQRFIDLDKDDDTALDKDFFIDSLCTHTNLPLSDLDIQINNEYPIDSIDIFILHPRFSQYLYFPNGNYILQSTPNFWQKIVNNGTTSIPDFEDAIKNAYLDIENDPDVTEVKIGFQVWYNGIAGDTAIATIKIAGPLPYAGQDNHVAYCENVIPCDISQISGNDADKNGLFYNTNFEAVEKIPNIAPEDSIIIYYITNNGICFDTANIQIKIHSVPSIIPVRDTTTCHHQNILIQLAPTIDSILWYDGSLSINKEINVPGTFHYTVKNGYGCTVSDTFMYTKLPAPLTKNIDIQICTDSIFIYDGTPVTSQGMYSDTLRNRLSCDSIITTLILSYYDEVPLIINGDTSICSGDETELIVDSNHTQIWWNSTEGGKTIKLNQGGPVSIVALDSNGCKTEKRIEILEYPVPDISTTDMVDTTYSTGMELTVGYNDPNLIYQWSPSTNLSCIDCPYPMILNKENGVFNIKVTNEYGCIDSAFMSVTFKESSLYFPNILSKSSSNNNIFYAQGNTGERYSIEIYDRWGNKVFRRENVMVGHIDDGWHPDESLSQGVYIYLVTYFDKGERKVVFGDITLIE